MAGTSLVDPLATEETRDLFGLLRSLPAGGRLALGHQNDLTQRVVEDASEGSDVHQAVGDHVGVLGISMDEDIDALVALARRAHRNGSILTVEDHMPNFSSGGDFTDLTPTARHILPGGKDHAAFVRRLAATAAFARQVVADDGRPVPIIYRPFHEHSGGWFWWGVDSTSEEEFVALWHFTVGYLRDHEGLRNLLYAYSPNGHFADEDAYLDRYPGDAWVDLLGFDVYHDRPVAGDRGWLAATVHDARIVTALAGARGKAAALTETGPRWNASDGLALTGNTVPTWYTDLLNALTADPAAVRLAYLLLWRNDPPGPGNPPAHFWVPFRGHPVHGDHELLPDFLAFARDERVLLAGDLKDR
jgi:mannan endo-1,4-beta-mannosidase